MQNEYLSNREKFIMSVMNDPYYIENICGVDKLMEAVNLDDVEVGDDF